MEEEDRGAQEEKRGDQKGREQASNQFLMYSPQSGPVRAVHGVTQRREEGGRRQVTRRRKGGVKRSDTDPANYQFPKCSPQRGTQNSQSWLGREERGRR